MSEEFELASRDLEGDPVFRAKELRRHSLDWLRKAWDALDDEKELERIRGMAERHLAKVKSYRIPNNDGAVEHLKYAADWAWHAIWMTFDLRIGNLSSVRNRQGTSLYKYSNGHGLFMGGPNGTMWSKLAYPKYDEDGKRLNIDVNSRDYVDWVRAGDISKLIIRADLAGIHGLEVSGSWFSSVVEDTDDFLQLNHSSNAVFSSRINLTVKKSTNCLYLEDAKINDVDLQAATSDYFFASANFEHPRCSENPLAVNSTRKLQINFRPLPEIGPIFIRNVWSANLSNIPKSTSLSCENVTKLLLEGPIQQVDLQLVGTHHLVVEASKVTLVVSSSSALDTVDVSASDDLASEKSTADLRLDLSAPSIDHFTLYAKGFLDCRINAEFVEDLHIDSNNIPNLEITNCKLKSFVVEGAICDTIRLDGSRIGALNFHSVSVLTELSCRGCHFEFAPDFAASRVQGNDLISLRRVDFHGAALEQGADFSNRIFIGETDFSETTWRGVPKFFGSKLNSDTNFRGAKYELPTKANAADGSKLAEFERGFRTLKLAMEELRARHDEAVFHRQELLARRAQKDQVPLHERWLSLGYDLLSGYGQSMAKPFLWWLGSNVLVGAWAWWLVFCDPERKWQAIWFGFINAIRPFYVSNPAFDRATTLADEDSFTYFVGLLIESGGTGFRVGATVHSLVSLVLVFLIALALRRRFQISG